MLEGLRDLFLFTVITDVLLSIAKTFESFFVVVALVIVDVSALSEVVYIGFNRLIYIISTVQIR